MNNLTDTDCATRNKTDESGATAAANDEELLYLFHRTASLLHRRFHHCAGSMDHGQGRLLHILHERGDMPQRHLQDIFQVRAGSLSEILSKLEQKGFIEKERDAKDRRASRIRLTPEGQAIAQGGAGSHAVYARALFAPLSEEERESLRHIMQKMLESLLEERDAGLEEEYHGHCHGHHLGHGRRCGRRKRGAQS